MKIKLTENEQKQSLIDLYDTIAAKMGAKEIPDIRYDCRHIEVAENVLANIREAFYELHPESTTLAFGAYILDLGPKVNRKLPDNMILVKPEFLYEKEKQRWFS